MQLSIRNRRLKNGNPQHLARMPRQERYISTLVLPPHMAQHVNARAEYCGTTQAAYIRQLILRDLEANQKGRRTQAAA